MAEYISCQHCDGEGENVCKCTDGGSGVPYNADPDCPNCSGSGMVTCSTCDGSGEVEIY